MVEFIGIIYWIVAVVIAIGSIVLSYQLWTVSRSNGGHHHRNGRPPRSRRSTMRTTSL
ncbi:MAG TPA: hypothetical protein VHI13_15855 [Candidatus Kapabacteria bacterium]|nr:hypothetical protein [Candidatus Kapabacteria bacterium]